MRVFIKLTFIFISIFFGVIILIIISTSFIERKKSNFKLPNNPKYIVIGHSHPQCAFNDSLIPNLRNLSKSGESYFYSYLKIKQVVKQNPSINVVFIEYTNNQINEGMNEWIWGDDFISNRYPKYSSFTSFSDNLLLLKNNPSSYYNALSLSIKEKSSRILNDNFNLSTKLGGYLYLKMDKTDSLINNMLFKKHKIIKENKDVSEANLSYLDALIDFCIKNGIKVILIRSPLHEKYSGFGNEKVYIEILKTRYENIEYIDFSKFPILNTEFGDLEHLNYKGAKVFSKWFGNLLNNGLLEKTNKQDYIEELIKHDRTKMFNK